MRGLIFTTAVLALCLALFTELSSAEESYFKKYIDTLQGMSADLFSKAADTVTQVKESTVGQQALSWYDTGAGFVRTAYDAVVDKVQDQWEALTA
ncbi:apolipoprotein C-III [Lissotriton helveticus]